MENILQEIDYKNLYHLCFEGSSHLALVLSDTLQILDINPQAEKLLKWPRDVVRYQSIHALFESTSMKPFVDLTAPISKQKKITYITNKKHNLKIFWTILPFFGANHQLKFVAVFGEPAPELTDKELRMQLENVVKYAPGLFYWKDKNSVYLGSNDEFARRAGLESWRQVKGKTDFDLAWKNRAEQYVEIDKQVIQTGQADLNREEIITTSSQQTITALTNKVPLFDKKNRVIGLMGITTDITHQKEVELHLKLAKEQAEIANRAKSEFIANMSHDIRTPLSGLVGMSQLLKERLLNSEEKQYAQWVSECGEQLLDLLNGILEVVSADNVSENDLHLETFNLHQCVEDIVQLGRPSTQLKGIQLTLQVGKDVPVYVVSDRTKLHRILLNLLGNAIKFTEEGSVHVDIQLINREDEHVTIKFQVIDTGIGIPAEYQDKVFDRFFRASPSYKGMYDGQGVGLHIVESYIDLLGGSIKLSSTPGEGTTFYFDLVFKLGMGEEIHLETKETPPVNPTIKSKPLAYAVNPHEPDHVPMILLVEDNTIARKVMECLMTDLNLAYKSCLDAESALILLQTQAYDLLITDIGLPGISGYDLTLRIRAWEQVEQRNPIPIIGLTAHAQDRVREECLRAGMSDVYSKPMNLATLKVIQSTYLQRSAMRHGSADEMKHEKRAEPLDLNDIPLLNMTHLLRSVNQDRALLRDILHAMAHDEIPKQISLIESAYSASNWLDLRELVHKMKGGAMYCATFRLQQVCQYFEGALSTRQHQKDLDKFYSLLLQVSEETRQAIILVQL